MAERIYKYELKPNQQGVWEVDMLAGAQILSVQVQQGVPQMWAVVNPDHEPERRTYVVPGTGHEFPISSDNLKFIATFQMGLLVWHVFEVVR